MTPIAQFTPTLMQKLLGRQYKWWYVTLYYLRSSGSGIYGFMISQFSDIIQTTAILYIWVLNNPRPEIITYLIIGRIYKALSDTFFAEIIGPDISTGVISKYFLYPQSYFLQSYFREIGRRFSMNIGRAVGFVVPMIIFIQYISWEYFSITKIILLACLLPISFTAVFFIELLVGMQAFFTKDKRNFRGIHRAYNGLAGVLSGIMIPRINCHFTVLFNFYQHPGYYTTPCKSTSANTI
jgi:ABC-type uncharacterized transport system permease subunit